MVIAAITSCTNTSNPRNVIAAACSHATPIGWAWRASPGSRHRWRRAPGGRAVSEGSGPADRTGGAGFWHRRFCLHHLQRHERRLDRHPARNHRPQAVCHGRARATATLMAASTLCQPSVPGVAPLVVAYALAGTVRFDIEKTCWPWSRAVRFACKTSGPATKKSTPWCRPPSNPSTTARCMSPCSPSTKTMATPWPLYDWRPNPPHPPPAVLGHRRRGRLAASPRTLKGMRPLALLPTTSPPTTSRRQRHPGGQRSGRVPGTHGPAEEDFNSYATHRGDHLTACAPPLPTHPQKWMVRGRWHGAKGSLAVSRGTHLRMWEAIETYLNRRQPLIIIAGRRLRPGLQPRLGRQRGVRLAGWKVVVAEGLSASTAPTSSAWACCRWNLPPA